MTPPNFEPVVMYTHSTDAGWISRTHRAISPFRLQKPATVSDVLDAISEHGSASIIAGGIDLTRRMRAGDHWDTVIDISGVSGLRGISDAGDTIRVGALATHWDIETDPVLAVRLPAFQAAWKTIGNVRIRMTGTVGGNIMAAEPGYDGRVLLAAAGGRLIFATHSGEIFVPADAGPQDMPQDALLTALEIPAGDGGKIAFDRSLKPVVSVAVGLTGDQARIAVGCAYASPLCWSGPVNDIGDAISAPFPDPKDDPIGSAGYRRRMIGVLARRLADGLQAGEAS
jgi:aerobic carbon-monoxide dehydrogenase medium subunit